MRVVGKMTIRKLGAFIARRHERITERRQFARLIAEAAIKNKTLDWIERLK